jgi:hypothetical protein
MSGQESLLPVNRAFVLQFLSKSNVQLGQFQGRAEHIASGQVFHFNSQQEFFDFVLRMLGTTSLGGNVPEDH